MLRIATRLSSVLVLSAALLVADGASAQFSFGGLRNSMINFVLRQVSVEGVFEISAEGIEQPEDGVTDLVGVKVADRDGVWLTADAFSLRWDASALLSGEVIVERLAARGLRVERVPVPPQVEVKEDAEIAGESRGLLDWPRAPITVRVEELALENAFLAAGVLTPDQSVAFDADGALRDEGDVQSARLNLTRNDAVEGRIDFSYARDFAAQSLDVTLQANEAAGGLVAALLSLPEGSASTVSLTAEGPLTDWRVALAAEAQRMLTVDATGRLNATGRLDAALDMELVSGDALPADMLAAIGDRATLNIAVTEDDQGRVQVERGAIRSPSVTADASGVYDKGTGGLDFDVTLEAREALSRPIEGVDFDTFGFDGRLGGTVSAFTAAGQVTLRGLSTAPADLGAADLRADVAMREDGTIQAALSGDAQQVRLDRLGPDLMGRTALDISALWDGAARRAELERAEISSPLLSVSASGVADVGADMADLRWTLSTPELDPVAAAYGQDASGRLQAEGQAQGALSAPRLTGSLAAQNLEFQGEGLGEVSLTHDVTLGEVISGQVSLDAATLRFGQAQVATRFAMEGQNLDLTNLHAEALGATLDGDLDVALGATLVEGDVALSAEDLSRLAPVFEALELGAPPAGAVTGQIRLRKAEGRQNAKADLTGEAISAMGYGIRRFSLDADARDLLSRPRAEGVLTAEGLTGPDGLALDALRFDGSARDLTGAASATGELVVEGVRGPDGISLRRAVLNGSGENLIDAPRAAATLTAEGLEAQGYRVAAITLDGTGANLIAAPEATATLTVEDITGPDGIAVARVTLDGSGTNLIASPSADAALSAEGIAGPGGVAADALRVDGTLRDLNGAGAVEADVTVSGLAAPGAQVRDVTAEISARDVLNDPAATLSAALQGIRAGGGTVGGATLSADLRGLASAPRGTAQARVNGVDIGGATLPSAVVSVDLTDGGAGRTDVAAELTSPGLTADGATLEDIRLTARARDALGTPVLDAALTLGGGAAADLTITRADVTATGPLSALQIAVDGAATLRDGRTGTLTTRATVDAEGDLNAAVSQFEIDVPEGEGRRPAPPLNLSLTQPLRVAAAGAATRVQDLALAFPGGTARGDLRLASGLSGNIGVEVDTLAPLSRLLELPLQEGALSLTADFDTGAGRAEAALRGRDLRMEGLSSENEPLQLTADATWARGRLDARAEATGGFGRPLLVTAALPLRGGGLVPTVPQNGELDAALQWEGRIAPLWALVPLPDHILDGELFVDLAIGGPISAPRPRGELRLTDGRYENLETGTILDDMTADAGLGAGGAMEVRLRADDGAGAPVTLDATIDGGALTAALRTTEAVLVRRDDASAAISMNIDVEGTLVSPAVTGDVLIDRAEIRLVNALPPSVADLGEVRWKGDPPPEKEETTEGGPTLDLKIRAPGDIFVRGRGLTSEWMLELDVTGSAAAPRVVGAVEKIRGDLRLLSRPFILERGRVVFDGGTEIDPRLDVALELERDDIIGRIAVRGRASEPEISLESSPSLPEEEVLPRILFGQSRQSLTAGQAAELASAAAALAGGGEGALGSLRQAAGLDVLALGESSGGTTAVEIGTDLVDGVYVGATQPVDGGKTEFEVEVEIFDNLNATGSGGGDGSASVGLDWKIDF